MQQGDVDVYGFPLVSLTQQQLSARNSCAAYEARRRSKWQKYVQNKELPTAAVLKRYCRKVCFDLESGCKSLLQHELTPCSCCQWCSHSLSTSTV